MSRWIVSAAALAVLYGCNDGDAGFFPGDLDGLVPDRGPTDMFDLGDGDMGDADAGPIDCGPGQIFDGRGCLDVPADPCTLTDPLLGAGCVDVDGDCFPDKCDDAIPDHLRDCDDLNADRRPGLLEGCDGVDNDCDAIVDEGLGIGDACEACGRAGVVECNRDGWTACSVEAGQSEAEALAEQCNGADEDCDGAIDEGCLLALTEAERQAPRWCADRLLWIEDGALIAWDLTRAEATTLDAGPVAAPTCDAERDAWLRTLACDGGGVGAPLVCAGAQLMLRSDGMVRPLAPFGALGAPALGLDGVYLHEGADAPVILRAPFNGMPADPIANGVSDPTAPVDDLIIARAVRGDQVVMEGVGVNRPSRTLDAPGQAPPGRPARDAELIAWIAGESPVLWVLPAARLGQGVQVGAAVGGVPWVVDGMVWWLAPDGLRRFDAESGQVELIDAGDLDARRTWIGAAGRVDLVDDGVRLWPTDPARFAIPEPDGGVPDAGVDAGPLDAGALDASIDAGAPDAAPMDAGVDAAADAAP